MTMIADARLDECREFLRSERGLSPQTVGTYTHHLRGYLGFLGDRGVDPAAVTQADVSAYLGRLRARGLQSPTVFCAAMAVRAYHRFLIAGSPSRIQAELATCCAFDEDSGLSDEERPCFLRELAVTSCCPTVGRVKRRPRR